MKYYINIFIFLSFTFSQAEQPYPPLDLVTIPTSGTLPKGSFTLESLLIKDGGIIPKLSVGITENFYIGLSYGIQDFISEEITASVRELVGAINRVVSFSRIYKKIPNLTETKVILKDLLNLNENKVTIDLIQTIVCKFFKISKNEMLSSRRSRYLVRPRQTAIYLTKILTSKSLPEIGREFSNRDHTTIIHSVKTIEKLKEKDLDMVDNINKLKNQILYNNN